MKGNILIVGAGVIGLSIAYKLSNDFRNIIIVDSEPSIGNKTSSRNTQIIHAGIYYKNNSLKSKFCLSGKELIYDFCNKYKVKYKKNKKIFVATDNKEIDKLNLIFKQASSNGVYDLQELTKANLKKIEPNINGVAGLLSPSSGIIDVYDFMDCLLKLNIDKNVIFVPNHEVVNAYKKKNKWNVVIKSDQLYNLECKIVINSSGNNSTYISKKIFNDPEIPISTPIRGSYLKYNRVSPFTHTIYPALTPGNNLPRVDATTDTNGILRFGPSTDKDENSYVINNNLVDIFLPEIQKYFPLVNKNKLSLDFCGFRPKISIRNKLVEDYIIKWNKDYDWLDLWGIDSPGLTASLSIAEYIRSMIMKI